MKVEWALLCNSALPHQDGTVSMLGAGLVQLAVWSVPHPIEFAVVTRVQLDPTDLPATVPHRVDFLGAEGEPLGSLVGELNFGPPADSASPVWGNVVQTMIGMIGSAGNQSIVVTVGDLPAVTCPLRVDLLPPAS